MDCTISLKEVREGGEEFQQGSESEEFEREEEINGSKYTEKDLKLEELRQKQLD